MSGYILNMLEIAKTYKDPEEDFYNKNVLCIIVDGLEMIPKDLLLFFTDM
jgi:hypothetical protein